VAREAESIVGFEDVADAAFARLAVDADDRLVRAPEIRRVDWQVGDGPLDVAVLTARREALADGVLVRARRAKSFTTAPISARLLGEDLPLLGVDGDRRRVGLIDGRHDAEHERADLHETIRRQSLVGAGILHLGEMRCARRSAVGRLARERALAVGEHGGARL
jgi:hypothetical protein